MSARTPGPWSVYNTSATLAVDIGRDAFGRNPCVVHWSGFESCGLPKQEAIANAHLIAAAPELLAACKAYLLADMQWQTALKCYDEIAVQDASAAIEAATADMRAAIKKAEGGRP